MLIRSGIAIGLATAFTLGYGVATWFNAPTPSSYAAVPSDSSSALANEAGDEAPNLIIAAGYSKRCATESGICTIDKPQKVGSRCRCEDGTRGTIVR
jgi:hypothetical protein